jgi:endoglucanase
MKNLAILALAVLVVAVAVCPAKAILGDVNGDGKVDMKDIAIVAKAFGATPSAPRWNPAADVNGDMAVNMVDIAIVASNLGK